MLFNEIIKELHTGKYVARGAWDKTGEYLVLLPGMQYIWKITTQPNPTAGNYMFMVPDFEADDWKIVGHVLPKDFIKSEEPSQLDAA